MNNIDNTTTEGGSSPVVPAPSPLPRASVRKSAAPKPAARPAPRLKPQSADGAAACAPGAALPSFADLWRGYPERQPSDERWPQDVVEQGVVLARAGELKYPDQCAIKLSVALHAGGIDMHAYAGAATMIDGKRAALRALELAAWLEQQPFCGAPLLLRVTGADWQQQIAGKKGIIYFANYWRRSGEAAPSGDHIDLWNQDTLSPSIESFFRFRLGIGRIRNPFDLLRGKPGNWYSNLDEATEIRLWQVA